MNLDALRRSKNPMLQRGEKEKEKCGSKVNSYCDCSTPSQAAGEDRNKQWARDCSRSRLAKKEVRGRKKEKEKYGSKVNSCSKPSQAGKDRNEWLVS